MTDRKEALNELTKQAEQQGEYESIALMVSKLFNETTGLGIQETDTDREAVLILIAWAREWHQRAVLLSEATGLLGDSLDITKEFAEGHSIHNKAVAKFIEKVRA